jgi:hypothetical protein
MMVRVVDYFHDLLRTKYALRRALLSISYKPVRAILGESFLDGHDPIFYLRKTILSNCYGYQVILHDRELWRAIYNLIETHPWSDVQPFPLDKVHGLDGARFVEGKAYRTLYDYGKDIRSDTHPNETDEDFSKTVDALGGPDRVFKLKYYSWDQKYYVSINDGSHRLAALHRQSRDQNRNHIIQARIQTLSIHENSCLHVLAKTHILVVSEENVKDLLRVLHRFDVPYDHSKEEDRLEGRVDAMETGCSGLPGEQRRRNRVFFFPIDHPNSEFVYAVLTSSLSSEYIFDISAYLAYHF